MPRARGRSFYGAAPAIFPSTSEPSPLRSPARSDLRHDSLSNLYGWANHRMGMGQELQMRLPIQARGTCAGNRERRYRRSRFLVKRGPSCRVLRGNGRVSVPTVPDSRATLPSLYRHSRFSARPGVSFTDAPGFPRSVPLLEHLVNAYQVHGGISLRLLLRGLGAGHLGKQIALVSVVARQQAAAVLQGRQGLRLIKVVAPLALAHEQLPIDLISGDHVY